MVMFRTSANWYFGSRQKCRLKSEGVEENAAFWNDIADSDFIILVSVDDLEIGDAF